MNNFIKLISVIFIVSAILSSCTPLPPSESDDSELGSVSDSVTASQPDTEEGSKNEDKSPYDTGSEDDDKDWTNNY